MNKKRLLLLGSSIWKDVINEYAKENDVYLIFAGNSESSLEDIVDETHRIDSTDPSVMIPFIKQNNIDGIFMGGSELVISKTCDYINQLGYPCYCTKKQWDICQNKKAFKQLCREYDVPCVPEFSADDDPSTFDYPVIIKPTDACAAKGISVCENKEEYNAAINKALEYSSEKKVIVEKYIRNGGTTMSVRYIIRDGELYLEAVGDRYVLNPEKGKALITAAAFYPSKHTEYYIANIDDKVKNMFKGIGLKNGVLFMESCFTDGKVYFYEMGLRISGGQTYKITEKTNGINELKMLINYSLTGCMCNNDDIKKIDPYMNGFLSASITVPLSEGKISSIYGMDNIKKIVEVGEIVQYWKEGESILPKHIGTLDQLFARIPIITKGKERLSQIMLEIKQNLSVKDENGQEMIIWSKFDEIYSSYIG